MMDNRKRCDGVGALFLRIGGGSVDKIRAFSSVFIYFGGARSGFGGYGRQNSGISLVFCLLQGPCGAFLEVAVDKIKAFLSFFVYFGDRTGPFWRQQ